MKRSRAWLAFVVVALGAPLGMAAGPAAAPANACSQAVQQPLAYTACVAYAGLDVVDQQTNGLLARVPAPPGWQPRHACVIVDEADKGWCITFPYPF